MDQMECFCHQACLKILFPYWSGLLLHWGGGLFDTGGLLRCCPVHPPLATGSWEHKNWNAVDYCKVWYGSILESARWCGFERQNTFKKRSISFKKKMVGPASYFCESCCQMVEKIQNGYHSIFSTEMNTFLEELSDGWVATPGLDIRGF